MTVFINLIEIIGFGFLFLFVVVVFANIAWQDWKKRRSKC